MLRSFMLSELHNNPSRSGKITRGSHYSQISLYLHACIHTWTSAASSGDSASYLRSSRLGLLALISALVCSTEPAVPFPFPFETTTVLQMAITMKKSSTVGSDRLAANLGSTSVLFSYEKKIFFFNPLFITRLC